MLQEGQGDNEEPGWSKGDFCLLGNLEWWGYVCLRQASLMVRTQGVPWMFKTNLSQLSIFSNSVDFQINSHIFKDIVNILTEITLVPVWFLCLW